MDWQRRDCLGQAELRREDGERGVDATVRDKALRIQRAGKRAKALKCDWDACCDQGGQAQCPSLI